MRGILKLGLCWVGGSHVGDGCLSLCPTALVKQVNNADVSLGEHPSGGVLTMSWEPLAGMLQHLPRQLVVSLQQ